MSKLQSYAYKTSQGPFLQLNEDAVSFDFGSNLFVLSDSFGGQGIGDKINSYIGSQFSEYYNNLTSDPDATLPLFFSPQYFIETNALANALKRIHEDIFKENMNQEPRFRGGSSISALSISDNSLHLCSVGANLCVLIRNGGIQQLDIAERTYGEGEGVTENAIGLFEHVQFQLRDIEIFSGDKVLILTDGVHQSFSLNEFLLLSKESFSDQDLLDNLISISNSRGNKDNSSGIVLSF